MKRSRRLLLPILLAGMAMAAGAAPPPAGGTVSIEPRTTDGEYDPLLATYVTAVGAALTDRGFTVLDDPGHAATTAEIVLGRTEVGTALAKVPGQSKPLIGPGVVVPLSTGASDVVPLERIRLEMRLRRRGESGVAFHAAAVTVRAAAGRKGAAQDATDLSRALLRSYPAEPPGDIGVP